MKFTDKIRQVSAGVLSLFWLIYAIANMVMQVPAIQMGYERSWNLESIFTNFADTTGSNLLGEEFLQDLNGIVVRETGKQALRNYTIIKQDNNQLRYVNPYPYERSDYRETALRLREVKEAAEGADTEILFLSCDDIYEPTGESKSPLPLNDLGFRSDELLYELEQNNIPYLDSREILKNSLLTDEECHYKTDSHWTIQAAHEVSLAVMEEMYREEESQKPEGLCRSNYQKVVYQNDFVGNMGKQIGIPGIQPEDFTLITPKFETDYTISYSQTAFKMEEKGDFQTSIMYLEETMNVNNTYEESPYFSYLLQLYPYRKITNNLITSGKRVLVIGDDYMLPVTAFLTTAASEVVFVWPYAPPEGSSSLEEYINREHFDQIIIGLNPGSYNDSNFGFLNQY
ncbi:hypothetical protein M2454_000281 [Aequitasia blattaphilus]|uniref:AlgX/AlgJ SGNH hydrolase-like domain-containing protein n=1 Tax=Aequitasia blattaphilus TaxID=2949332 RepID=A0ABT1E5D2_9FIRM|nr:hypothetical protein [Aequitasia blattaphilus]MCP1101059.1 hypothetical protein [Aequitasia blattaphilus]MCR8613699.1 hypothetical protein [Aequitasia blattaphilus]